MGQRRRAAAPNPIMPGFVLPVQPPAEPTVHDSPVRVALYDGWDRLDNAIRRVETAQPFQMTEAAAEMEQARRAFDLCMRALLMEKPSPASSPIVKTEA